MDAEGPDEAERDPPHAARLGPTIPSATITQIRFFTSLPLVPKCRADPEVWDT
jgi:hypothetical protein